MSTETAIRVIQFSGKKVEWPTWEEKFLARAKRRNYKDLLLDKVKVPDATASDPDPDVQKDIDKRRDLNELGYSDLILSMDTATALGRVAFNIIKLSKNTQFPDGNINVAWAKLKAKYAPDSAPHMAMLSKKFYASTLKQGSDPDLFITYLEDLRGQLENMSFNIDENQFMIHILNNLTKDYEVQVTLLERDIGSTSNPLTIEEIRNELSLRYERLKKSSASTTDSDKALFAGGKFKGNCHYCGKQGHKREDCWENPQNKGNGRGRGGRGNKGGRGGRGQGRGGGNDSTKSSNQSSDNTSSSNNNNRNHSKRFNGTCNYCNKYGHRAEDCWSKKNADNANTVVENKAGDSLSDTAEVLMMASSRPKSIPSCNMNYLWLADSGASCHMTNSDVGMYDCKTIKSVVTIGNGTNLVCNKIGKKKLRVVQTDGKIVDIILDEVKYVPGIWLNLFSITKVLKNGWKLSNEDVKIRLTKNNTTILFDRQLTTENGLVVGAEMIPRHDCASLLLERGSKVDINVFHNIMGHANIDAVRKTASYYGIKLTGTFQKCENCAMAKIRTMPVKKSTETKATKFGERLYIDISPIKAKSYGGSNVWLLIVDDYTDYCWS
jgi:hypothetical protein